MSDRNTDNWSSRPLTSNQLPSREEAADLLPYETGGEIWPDDPKLARLWDVMCAFLSARASGRLVDREAIDYEAGTHTLGLALDDQEPDAVMARATIDAAIGDTDE